MKHVNLFYILIAIIAVAVIFTAISVINNKKSESNSASERIIISLLLFCVLSVASIGMFDHVVVLGHDINFHMLRIQGMAENISRGVPFNKINFAFADGYGYLNSVFYPQLFLWIPAVLVSKGIKLAYAYRVLILLINLVTVAVSYICFSKIADNRIYGLFASAVYVLNYYRLSDIYIRAAVGELLYIAFLPIVFYGIYLIFNGKSEKWYVVTLGACCIFQSHILGTVLTAIMGCMLIAGYMIKHVLTGKEVIKPILALVKAGVMTLLLNVWYLVPMVYYLNQDFKMFDAQDNMERFSSYTQDFYTMFWRIEGFDDHSILSHMGVITGITVCIILILVLISVIKKRFEGVGTFVYATVFLFVASTYIPWDKVASIGLISDILVKIQFSFRMLSAFIALMVLAAMLILKNYKNNSMKNICIVMACLFIVSIGYFHGGNNKYYVVNGYGGDYVEQGYTPEEYFMKIAKNRERTRDDKLRTSDENLHITEYSSDRAGVKIVIENNLEVDAYMDIPLYYYDGYVAFSESAQAYLPVQAGENGVIRVLVPTDVTGNIFVYYDDKWFFHIAKAVSAATVVLLTCGMIVKKHKIKVKD